jgi:hypothetical protein
MGEILVEKRSSGEREERKPRSKSGRIPPHPAVFVRVANKGVISYGTWKNLRNFVEAYGVSDTRQFS